MGFPVSLDTFHTCVNNLTFSLTADYVAADPTIFVNSTTGAPTAGSFHLGSNIIYYTGKTANSFTGCTGGNDGTADVNYAMQPGGNEVVFGPEAHNVNDLNTAVGALQTKVGIDGSAVTSSHDYKLSGVTGTDKAVSKTGTETITNKTLTSPVINTPTGDVATKTGTETLTNKRITKRVGTSASAATHTIDSDSYDMFTVTAQAEAVTFAAPSGTPTQGQALIIRLKDDGTARALTWNAIFRAGDIALPTTTVLSKTMYCGFIYNSTDSKWDLVAYLDNF